MLQHQSLSVCFLLPGHRCLVLPPTTPSQLLFPHSLFSFPCIPAPHLLCGIISGYFFTMLQHQSLSVCFLLPGHRCFVLPPTTPSQLLFSHSFFSVPCIPAPHLRCGIISGYFFTMLQHQSLSVCFLLPGHRCLVLPPTT